MTKRYYDKEGTQRIDNYLKLNKVEAEEAISSKTLKVIDIGYCNLAFAKKYEGGEAVKSILVGHLEDINHLEIVAGFHRNPKTGVKK
jgi:hypothetical protein